MYVVEVIPISRGMRRETLSYFTGKETSVGAVVEVPLRNKRIPALVLSSAKAADAKTALKRTGYALKKLSRVGENGFFLPEFVKAAAEYGTYAASGTGAAIDAFSPKTLLSLPLPKTRPHEQKKPAHAPGKFVLQADEEERRAIYKGIVREAFARKKSVIICVPSAHDAERMHEMLRRGIEEYAYVIHAGMSPGATERAWSSALSASHPVLVIGTGVAFSLPRGDWGTVIVDQEDSFAYKMKRRPFADGRTFAEFFADELGAQLLFGASLLRVETLYKEDRGNYTEFAPLKFRILSPAEQSIVDMRKDKSGFPARSGKFYMISDELKSVVADTHENNSHLFILAARRGLSPVTVCGDCGNIVLCGRCSAPAVLHSRNSKTGAKGNIFLCHKCGERRNAEDQCSKCDGWRLTPLGIGAEKGEEELRSLFPKGIFFRLDKDTATTKKKAEKIVEEFYANPGSVLIGTEMALGYLHKKIAATAVLSIDSLFTLPDFRIHEKIFFLLMKLRSLAVKKFIIQTRAGDNQLFEHVVRGNALEFYRQESKNREAFRYPPFSLLIKLTHEGSAAECAEEKHRIESLFKEYEPVTFPAFTAKVRGRFVVHTLLKVSSDTWPDTELLRRLMTLPPSVSIAVDPEHLL